ncbi:iron-enterobactin transporter ATP-binding protein [Streptomyces badius]
MVAQFTTETRTEVEDVARLAARGVTVGYGGRAVIDDLDVAIPPGVVTTIIGPNGCGKSTLLRTLTRLLKTGQGARSSWTARTSPRLRTRDVAKKLGLLPQAPVAPGGADGGRPRSPGTPPAPELAAAVVVGDADVVRARPGHDRGGATWPTGPVDSLSGGQRQRVWISMTLAQGTDLLLLDEPTTLSGPARTPSTCSIWSTICTSRGAPSSWCCTISTWPRATATTSS